MSDTAYQNCSPSLHGGELPYQRSYRPLFRHLETFSEQGPISSADDVSHIQGIGKIGIRRDNDDAEYHERHWSGKRCPIQGERNKGIMPDHRRGLGVQNYNGDAKGLARQPQCKQLSDQSKLP